MSTQGAARRRTLADRLSHLFAVVHPSGRGPYSDQEVAEAINAKHGKSIDRTYIWSLRTGRRDNPSMRHLEVLAEFFGVPVGYFFDDALSEEVAEEIALVAKLRDSGVQKIALRIAELDEQSREAVSEMLDMIVRLRASPKE
jgi:transcriptional regulator with XRE-family HTH domain